MKTNRTKNSKSSAARRLIRIENYSKRRHEWLGEQKVEDIVRRIREQQADYKPDDNK